MSKLDKYESEIKEATECWDVSLKGWNDIKLNVILEIAQRADKEINLINEDKVDLQVGQKWMVKLPGEIPCKIVDVRWVGKFVVELYFSNFVETRHFRYKITDLDFIERIDSDENEGK